MEARRSRMALIAAIVGIGAALIAYALSPTVRHAVGHAEHSVKHTVSNIFDHDHAKRPAHKGARAKARHPQVHGQHAKAPHVVVRVQSPAHT
jgi:hypothetical protein